MHNGNPKLTCNDETCDVCAKVFKDIVQTLPRYGYRCEECRNRLKQENISAEKEFYKLRSEQLQSNRDFIAEDIGWKKENNDQWYHAKDNVISFEHPIQDNLEAAKKTMPDDWTLKIDSNDETITAYHKDFRSNLMSESKQINIKDFFFSSLTTYHGLSTGESYDDCVMHDVYDMVAKVRKAIKSNKQDS